MKLGRFIEEMLEEKRKTMSDLPHKKFREKSDTVSEKGKFCRQALGENDANITYENMTEECKNLVRKVLTFIMKQNASIWFSKKARLKTHAFKRAFLFH